MSGFAIHANESLPCSSVETGAVAVAEVEVPPRNDEWFKDELTRRGVKGFEIICGDYRENFNSIPSHLLDQYLELRPRMLHRTALAAVLEQEGKK